jgi:PAS domain S-box-containing protein
MGQVSNTKQELDGNSQDQVPLNVGTSPKLILIAMALAGGFFALDLVMPLGVAGGMPYILLIVLGWWFEERLASFVLAAAASALIILGFFLSPEGVTGWIVLTNRIYAIIAIWGTAYVIWHAARVRDNRRELSMERLQRGQFNQFLISKEDVIVFVLMLLIAAASWGVLLRIEGDVKKDIAKSLKTALETSHVSIRSLFESHKNPALIWANNVQLRLAAKELSALPVDAATLIHSRAQKKLRADMDLELRAFGYRGYFVIGKDNINLASSRDGNVGHVNLLTRQTGFLNRVWAGETLISLPLVSDVPLRGAGGEFIKNLATMFVASPVKDPDGKVIAILAFRLDPNENFAPIFAHGRFGVTGETYAFDSTGLMISESRFISTLQRIGLLNGEYSSLNVDIRDPGVNLVENHKAVLPRGQQPLTRMAKSATAGEHGLDLDGYNDYRGVPVVGAWHWDATYGFGIATEADVEEVYTSFNNMRVIILVFSGLTIGVMIVLALTSRAAKRKIMDGFERNKLLLSSVGEGIYGLDTQGRTIFVNPAACEMLGYEEEELIGQPMHALVHHSYPDGSHYPRNKCYMYAAFTDGDLHQVDDEVLWHKDGTSFPVEYTSTPIREGANLIGAVVTFRDIAERKRVEKEIVEAKEEAEAANLTKSEFLASMSHEIRTPMTGVMGFSDMLLEDNLPDASMEKVYRIKDATRSLLTIINDILDISKMEAGKMEIETIDFHLPSLINDVLGLFEEKRKHGRQKDLKLEVALADDFPSSVNADPTRLRQILVNLIGNAVKFTQKGGVTVEGTLVQTDDHGGVLQISIHDTGIGMTEETISKLFSEFTQADASISREFEGTGLGLAICKRLVDLMGGEIGIESKVGAGSTFWFTVPYVMATLDVSETYQESQSSISDYQTVQSLSILVAEDNLLNQRIIRSMLEGLGHTVEIAENGAKAVEAYEHGNFDLIFMDVRMPEMSGPDATRVIRQMGSDKSKIPIIAITADAMNEHKKGYFEAGMDDCVTKPIDRAELVQAINKCMDKDIHIAIMIENAAAGEPADTPDEDVEDEEVSAAVDDFLKQIGADVEGDEG